MKIKIAENNAITVVCGGSSKKDVLKDLADATAFIDAHLDVATVKAAAPKKRAPRKKKAAVKVDKGMPTLEPKPLSMQTPTGYEGNPLD